MKLVEYIVKIPKDDTFVEFSFNSTKDVCDKLEITTSALFRIINGTMKYNTKKLSAYEGIIIEKREIKKEKEPITDKTKFQNDLINKLTNSK